MNTPNTPNTSTAKAPEPSTLQINMPKVPGSQAAAVNKVVQANVVDTTTVDIKKDAKYPILPEGKKVATDYIPANWHMVDTTVEGIVHVTNNISGKIFQGTRKDFVKYLRSE